jgi:hypothetical protein
MLSHFELSVSEKTKWKAIRSEIERRVAEFDYIFFSIDAHCTNEGALQFVRGKDMAAPSVSDIYAPIGLCLT